MYLTIPLCILMLLYKQTFNLFNLSIYHKNVAIILIYIMTCNTLWIRSCAVLHKMIVLRGKMDKRTLYAHKNAL